jgi:RhtB (resistance to homoserine/threonine) family protein
MSLTLLGFLTVLALTYVVPGPDFAVVLRNAARSARAGYLASAGVLTGLCVHITAAALGLSALLAQSAVAFTVVKVVGAGYLVFLGFQALWSSRKKAVAEAAPEPGKTSRLAFAQGFVTNVSNPKAVLFFVSLMPQFIDRSAPVLPQTLLLGLLTLGFGVVWWPLLVNLANRIRGVFARPRVRRVMDRVTGVVFIGLGIRLLRTPIASAST